MSILIFAIILLGLVTIHEFGHFIVAKLSGIRVDEFAFGFPPKIFGKKIGETEYKFNLLPLGGYVKIYGEDAEEVAVDHPDYERSFFRKSPVIQGAVIVAGVFFNLLAAWGLFATTFILGAETSKDLAPAGVTLQNEHMVITTVASGSPAEKAGLIAGDTIHSFMINGATSTLPTPADLPSFVAAHQEDVITVRYTTNQKKGEQVATLIPSFGTSKDKKMIGIATDVVGTLRLPLGTAIFEGARSTFLYTKLTALGFGKLIKGFFTRESSVGELTGPIGIVGIVEQARQYGIVALLTFAALISINLAVLNLVPFPALDGGRFLFIAIEGITRKKIPAQFQMWANTIGFGLLLSLMLVVSYQDIAKLLV